MVERIEIEAAGMLGRPERVPAMCFLDLVGYTRLTEERGDAAAAELAASLAVGAVTACDRRASDAEIPLFRPAPM
jgi:class 3 adenylate cyclase